jgi:hypothetical protein
MKNLIKNEYIIEQMDYVNISSKDEFKVNIDIQEIIMKIKRKIQEFISKKNIKIKFLVNLK